MKRYSVLYPTLSDVFSDWLLKYAYPNERPKNFNNRILYELTHKKDYCRAVVDFISGMTDMFAIKIFHEITTF